MVQPIKPAQRTEKIAYAIRDVVVEAQKQEKAGKKILYLNIGDPLKFDFETPRHITEAVHKNWKASSSYADSLGLPAARAAIAKEAHRLGIKDVTTDDVIVTSGGSEGINFCIGALMNKGENILVPAPGYPLYNGLIDYYEGENALYYPDEENEWQPDLDEMRKKVTEKTKGIVIINPNNPTGAVYSKKTLQGVLDIAAEHNVVVFSDETYDKLLFDGEKHVATASLSQDVPIVTFNSLSKNYLA
ncbi:aminotransferase, partial [Candidatus Woesearchaeota archaeon CG_4_10_14_0_8_um_filter_47_5]